MGMIVVIVAERTKAADAHVRERIAAGLCIACKDNPRKHVKRGLCTKCHGRWFKEREKLGSKQKKADFDSELIRRGALLDENEITRLKAVIIDSNVFADVGSMIAKS